MDSSSKETSLDADEVLALVLPRGEAIYVCSSSRHVLGIPPRRLLRGGLLEHVHDEDQLVWRVALWRATARQAASETFSFRLTKTEGWQWIDAECSVTNPRNHGNEILVLVRLRVSNGGPGPKLVGGQTRQHAPLSAECRSESQKSDFGPQEAAVGLFVPDEGRSGTSDFSEKSDRESELGGPNLPITINRLPASYGLHQNLVRAHIIDQVEGAVVSTDPVGNIATWSRGAEQMYGYSAQEVVGRYIGLLFPQRRNRST
jgi:PAS domain-containing protein